MSKALSILTTGYTWPMIERAIDTDPKLKSPDTRRAYKIDMRQFEAWRKRRALTKGLVESWAADIQREGKSPKTINRRLSSVRWWARKLADMAGDVVTTDPVLQTERAEVMRQALRVAMVEDVSGSRNMRGRDVSELEAQRLIDACRNAPKYMWAAGTRDATIMALAWQTGMRRSEIVGLTLADLVEYDDGYIVTIRHGKGDKSRVVYLYNGAAEWMREWLALRGDFDGPLFVATRKGGSIQRKGMTTEALAQRLEYWRVAAGVDALTWHDFRRTLAGDLLDAGHDIVTVGNVLGHSDPKTTKLYDRRGEHAKQAAIRGRKITGPKGRAKPGKA